MSAEPSEEWDPIEELVARVLAATHEARDSAIEAIGEEHPELVEAVLEALDKLERFERGHASLDLGYDSAEAEEAFPSTDPTSRYAPLALHDQGGMGEIWRVADRQLGRVVAMKVLHPRNAGGPQDSLSSAHTLKDLRRFYEEARIMGQLDHPGVLVVHDVGRDPDGKPFFTMPLVQGETLVDVFAKHARLEDGWTLRRCLDILVKVCDTLAHAHSRGVIHRDLKPSNIMVGRFGEVYVMDWGIAKVLGDGGLEETPEMLELLLAEVEEMPTPRRLETVRGMVIGTPQYMAPEQALQQREDFAATVDVYAVGALLYELLVGSPPYGHATGERSNREVLRAVREGPPEPAFELAPDAPEELLAICAKAMAREIEQRYQTMPQLRDDLRNYLDGNVVIAHRTGPVAHVVKWFERNTAIGLTIAVALIYAGVALAMFIHRTRSDRLALIDKNERLERVTTLVKYQTLPWKVEYLQTRVENDLHPLAPQRIRAMESWVEEAEVAREMYVRLQSDLEELRRESRVTLDVTGVAASFGGQPGFVEVPRNEEYGLMESLTRRVRDFFEGPEEGLLGTSYYEVARALESLKRAQALEASPPEGFPTWEEAREAIRISPRYDGLDLEPQTGMVPLGENPRTGLWEFADALTGEMPRRDVDGRWIVDEGAGLIFVLVPGGLAEVGSDPAELWNGVASGPGDDEFPLHRIAIEAFFLSKYEMTVEQWRRITGREAHSPELARVESSETNRLPAENLSWKTCDRVLLRLGMGLPTEVQWEYACRAGTRTPWSLGPLDTNLGERSTRLSEFATPVGSWPGNPFGFYDMHGNVAEWCRDAYAPYRVTPRPGDGLRDPLEPTSHRVLRGGSYLQDVSALRSSARAHAPAELLARGLGVRPARSLR